MKTIVVTGTSSGFGKRIVEKCLENPNIRVIASLRGGEERGKKVFLESTLTSSKGRLFFWDLEFNESLSIEKIQKDWKEKFNFPIDVLINNAGYGMLGPALDQSLESLRKQFEVNFFAPITLIHSLVPFMRAGFSRVINLSSICGLATFPFYGAYCSTKYALEAYTEGLNFELRKKGIQFSLVEPGSFKTEFNERAKNEVSSTPSNSQFNFEKEKKIFAKFISEKKGIAGNPEKVVDLIIKLINKKNTPLRVTVGLDAFLFSSLKRFLPERVWNFLVRFFFGKMSGL